jgi:hypothetical protein
MTRILGGSIAIAIVASGCTTVFKGSAQVPGGRPGCERVCADWRMELVGMVQMGGYSDGCICQVPGKQVSSAAGAAAAQACVAAFEAERQNDQARGDGRAGRGGRHR